MLEFAQGTCEVMQYRYVARLLTANGSVGHHDGAGAVTARVPRYRTESKCLVTLVCLRDHRYAFVSPRSDDPQAVGCNCHSLGIESGRSWTSADLRGERGSFEPALHSATTVPAKHATGKPGKSTAAIRSHREIVRD